MSLNYASHVFPLFLAVTVFLLIFQTTNFIAFFSAASLHVLAGRFLALFMLNQE